MLNILADQTLIANIHTLTIPKEKRSNNSKACFLYFCQYSAPLNIKKINSI